jgi:hypothetical protein
VLTSVATATPSRVPDQLAASLRVGQGHQIEWRSQGHRDFRWPLLQSNAIKERWLGFKDLFD